MKYLIVSADDFGLAKSVNEGIVKAYKDGIVTSVNLVPSGEAFENALELIKSLEIEDAGAHLALTETASLSDNSKVPSLIGKDGRFPKNHGDFFPKLFLKKLDLSQVYTELNNQLERIEKAGVRITCLSGHEHIQMMPEILGVFIRLAAEYNIPSIRCLYGEKLFNSMQLGRIYRSLVLAYFTGRMRKDLARAGIKHADNFIGFLDSGNLTKEILINMAGSLEEGTTELVCHPGFLGPEIRSRYRFHLNCEQELSALTDGSVRKALEDAGVKLISYRDFLLMK